MQHIGTQEIETPRLHLRRFTVEDAPAMFRNWASDPEVTRYLTWQPHPSVTDTEATLARWAADYEKPDTYRWCMEWKATGEVIGSIDVVDGNDNVRRAEIGYCMSRRFWGQGIMTEALIAVEDYLFSKAGYNRVEACHDVHNPASGKVMQKSGMQQEGVLRQHHANNQGNPVDIAVYSILYDEWKLMNRNK
ncbi:MULTISPECIES: GNAT family N-acetyltransferase [Caproicibacterium]|uniref:GNAT family N-acetyltransferase n=1 Tax=Caproicibacterium argilliputei TaxID=3030016 RepID=A0AA97DCG7_9FIRM|nr:GNAT family N-acetyltransferase [Caproicibacterium argilliputei]WOC32965.1 GNAT family N-acetyltransferase [Caproicibacterium argilliputei]